MTASYAWGPERETFSTQSPSAVLNSVTNAPGVGDERNFVRVRKAGTLDTWVDYVEVAPGGRYEVYIYFRNDAASQALSGVKAQSYFSRFASDSMDAVVMAGVRADGSEMFWDSAKFVTRASGVELKYVEGSAKIHSNGAVNGSLVEGIFSYPGVNLGYDMLSGVLPGGLEYAGYITYEVEAVAVSEVEEGAIYGESLTRAQETTNTNGGEGQTTTAEPIADTPTEEVMPETGAGGGIAIAVVMGAVVALGWSILRKIHNYGKIGI